MRSRAGKKGPGNQGWGPGLGDQGWGPRPGVLEFGVQGWDEDLGSRARQRVWGPGLGSKVSHPPTLTPFLTRSHSLSLTHTISLSHTHSLACSTWWLCSSASRPLSLSRSTPLSHSHTHSPTLPLPVSLTLSLTLSLTHSLTLALSHARPGGCARARRATRLPGAGSRGFCTATRILLSSSLSLSSLELSDTQV